MEKIDEYILKHMNNEVEKKGKNPTLWLLLTVIGVAIIVVSFSKSLSDSLQTFLLTVGSAAAAVGAVLSVLCITKTMWVYQYLPTGKSIKMRSIYLSIDDYKQLKTALADHRYAELGKLQPQVSTNMGAQLAGTTDGKFALLQGGRYDVGHFEPETEVFRLDGAESAAVQSWIK